MKTSRQLLKIFVYLLFTLAAKTGFAQNVGISPVSSFTPDASAGLDVSYTNKGLLVPRVALTATNAAGPITSPATSLLIYNTATAGTAPNNVIPGYYYWDGTAWNMLSTSAQTASSSWLLTGNAGTTAGTNFLGTTDAQDLVFKANNTERLRIVNGVSSATGTAGDVTIGDATSGTLRSAKELLLRQDGDIYGSSALHLRNRNGENGAIFETTGGSANLVDFIFRTGAAASPISSNIRFETRPGNTKTTGNSTEWQFGQPGLINGGPTLVVGASGAGSNSSFLTGNVSIGNNAPTEKLDITGNLKFSGALMPNNDAGTAGYYLRSGGTGTPPVWFDAGNLVTSQAWGLTGNTGTTAGTNFIGTTDATDFVVKTNNTEVARFASAGNVGIGGTAFNSTNPEQLLVDAGTSSSFNVISGKGNLNNYLQLNIQNNNAGTSASSDVVASNNTATESVNYIDMGINSSANTSTGVIGGANTAYLYSTGNDFAIGNGTSGKNLLFFTGGTASNERMRINSTGYVGITNTNPVSTLDVNGSVGSAITVLTTTNVTLSASNYTAIIPSAATATVSLPVASSCARRIYIIINQSSSTRALAGSYSYVDFTGAASTALPANSSIAIQSNGISWYRIQ